MQRDEGDARLLEPGDRADHPVCVQDGHCARSGFVETVYENALDHEVRKCGLGTAKQRATVVFYDDVVAGECTANVLVVIQVAVERKVVAALSDMHLRQCRNDLRVRRCRLINFGRPKLEIRGIGAICAKPMGQDTSLIATAFPFIPAYPFDPP